MSRILEGEPQTKLDRIQLGWKKFQRHWETVDNTVETDGRYGHRQLLNLVRDEENATLVIRKGLEERQDLRVGDLALAKRGNRVRLTTIQEHRSSKGPYATRQESNVEAYVRELLHAIEDGKSKAWALAPKAMRDFDFSKSTDDLDEVKRWIGLE